MCSLPNCFKPLAPNRSPIAGRTVNGAVWARPELRAEAQYCGLAATDELRRMSFKALREDL